MVQQTVTKRRKTAKKPMSKGYFGLILLAFVAVVFAGSNFYIAAEGQDPLVFYSNLANPYMRYVYIPPGLRREEIAEIFRKTLSWSPLQVQNFLNAAPSDDRGKMDGYYMPGKYWVANNATGKDVATQMLNNFNSTISKTIIAKNSNPFNGNINLDTAVRIASLIEKEAAGKKDMNLISGVIWNRIFKGMNLQIDATLQYAKASSTDWWPNVQGKDKYIQSPFNTYTNKGLPPIAIANPSIEAIAAAVNPAKTSCLYYIHDNNRNIHCTATYEAHKANVQKYLIGKK